MEFPSDHELVWNSDGFVNSGFISGATGGDGPPLPSDFELTFGTAGTYRYYCVLHTGGPDDPLGQGMIGEITVS